MPPSPTPALARKRRPFLPALAVVGVGAAIVLAAVLGGGTLRTTHMQDESKARRAIDESLVRLDDLGAQTIPVPAVGGSGSRARVPAPTGVEFTHALAAFESALAQLQLPAIPDGVDANATLGVSVAAPAPYQMPQLPGLGDVARFLPPHVAGSASGVTPPSSITPPTGVAPVDEGLAGLLERSVGLEALLQRLGATPDGLVPDLGVPLPVGGLPTDGLGGLGLPSSLPLPVLPSGSPDVQGAVAPDEEGARVAGSNAVALVGGTHAAVQASLQDLQRLVERQVGGGEAVGGLLDETDVVALEHVGGIEATLAERLQGLEKARGTALASASQEARRHTAAVMQARVQALLVLDEAVGALEGQVEALGARQDEAERGIAQVDAAALALRTQIRDAATAARQTVLAYQSVGSLNVTAELSAIDAAEAQALASVDAQRAVAVATLRAEAARAAGQAAALQQALQAAQGRAVAELDSRVEAVLAQVAQAETHARALATASFEASVRAETAAGEQAVARVTQLVDAHKR
ncbi:MAG TPA: hypothetical protein VFH47_06050, partial [Candidatus Thermoplasmatota archaeon]|nr:hypothetical protein [Candidatus Thermoplasmatota archaeon]